MGNTDALYGIKVLPILEYAYRHIFQYSVACKYGDVLASHVLN